MRKPIAIAVCVFLAMLGIAGVRYSSDKIATPSLVATNASLGSATNLGSFALPSLTASRIVITDGNKVLASGTTPSSLMDNFFAMGVSNILAASGIALATNNGVLWITNTGVASTGQPGHVVLTNLSATGVTPAATNQSAYIASASGRGTNLTIVGVLHVTNSSGILLGLPGEIGTVTNQYFWNQRGQLTMTDSGQSVDINSGAFIEINHGSTLNLGLDTGLGTDAVRVGFQTNAYIYSVTDSEINRYRLVNDNTGNITNRIIRWIELSNYVAAAPGGGALLNVKTNSVNVGNQTAVNFLSNATTRVYSTNNSGSGWVDVQFEVHTPWSNAYMYASAYLTNLVVTNGPVTDVASDWGRPTNHWRTNWVGTIDATNAVFRGGSPSVGSVWRATNTTGQGTWGPVDLSDSDGVTGVLPTGNIADDAVTDAKLRNSTAWSVIGRSANSSGNPGDIAGTATGQALVISGSTLGFGAIDLSDSDAITGTAPRANIPVAIAYEDEANAFTAIQIFSGPFALTSSATSSNLDWSLGPFRTLSLACSTNIAFSSLNNGVWIRLLVTQDSVGTWSVGWPSGIVWLNATNQTTAPEVNTNASSRSLYTLFRDGGTVYGSISTSDAMVLQDLAALRGLAKGDLFVYNGTNLTRQAAGSDGLFLSASSSSSNGVAWASAGGGNFDTIGDPSGDGLIAFGGTKQLFTTTLDGGAVLTITNSDADAASDTYLLRLAYNDGADANAIYAQFLGDADGTPVTDYLFSETLFQTSSGITVDLDASADVLVPTASVGDNDTSAASTAFVTAAITAKSNFVVSAHGNLFLTNQIRYQPLEYNGSNGTSAVALTNNWDFQLATHRMITNVVGTNLTYNLSNATPGLSLIASWKGNGGYSNTISFTSVSGTNIVWHNWATNGTYDILVRPGQTYTFQAFVNLQSNIVAWVSTDDPMVPVSSTWHYAVNSGISNLVATNISVKAGGSLSNATVGGRIYWNATSMTNCCASGSTNMMTYTAPAHTLTNSGDSIRVQSAFRLSTTGQSKTITLMYGTPTNLLFSTGSQAISNGVVNVTVDIFRTGGAEIYYKGFATWDRAVAGGETNFSGRITTLTNGIDNQVLLVGSAGAVATITNELLSVDYIPASR